MEWRERNVGTNGITLHIAEAGPNDGPPVILLHGFPEYHYGWKYQIPALAQAGFHVIAPDQRGYNLSDKPHGIASYNLDVLTQDIIALADGLDWPRFHLVGHDWGAEVAWWAAMCFPDRLSTLVILNGPHPVAFSKMLRRDIRQWTRSWYMGFFQIPVLPEWILLRRGTRALEQVLQSTARPGAFTADDLERYHSAWSQPGALTGMLNWYRAIVQAPPKRKRDKHVHVRTLILWGARDSALRRELAQASIEMCDDGRLVMFEEATHWIQHEEPDRVNQLLINFIRTGRAE